MSATHHDQALHKRIEQLEAELRVAQQQLAKQQRQLEARRQEFVHEYGPELLALIERDARAKVFITPIVERLVFQDEQGIGKLAGVHWESRIAPIRDDHYTLPIRAVGVHC